MKQMTDQEILDQREKEYGDAYESFSSIAKLWSEYLNTTVSPEQVAVMMALLKIHRSKTAKDFHYFDSLQDGRNYLTLAEKIKREEISRDEQDDEPYDFDKIVWASK